MAIESEKRFKKALDLLERSVKKQQEKKSANESALEAQNKVLQEGLDNLKQDYEKMENIFLDLKEQVKEAQKDAAESQAKTGDADVVALTEERDTLKEELALTRKDHEALEDSFAALKRQFAEVEEGNQEFISEMSASNAGVVSEKEFNSLQDERDALAQELEKIKEVYVLQLAENELLLAEANGVEKTKESLKKSLDNSIQKLEQMSLN